MKRPPEPPSVVTIYQHLLSVYGPQEWWPGDSPIEIMVGAVLTQNTAWYNVAIAIANLKGQELLNLERLLHAPEERVKTCITPSGFFNLKYRRLMNLMQYVGERGSIESLQAISLESLRRELLNVNGVGPETADSILLYALGRPIFVVDAYTRRLFSRLGYAWVSKAPYDRLQAWFMEQLSRDVGLYNEYHALIVMHCKDICRKSPVCTDCELDDICRYRPRSEQLTPHPKDATRSPVSRIEGVEAVD